MQLSFQAALDPYHAVFRLFRLLPILEQCGAVEINKVRILDFYLAFPFRVGGMKFKQGHGRYRKVAQEFATAAPYGGQPDDKLLFDRMEPMQRAAIQTLVAQGFIDGSELEGGLIKATLKPAPEVLKARAGEQNKNEEFLMELLGVLCSDYPLYGENGLKDRTQLMEYRYDAV